MPFALALLAVGAVTSEPDGSPTPPEAEPLPDAPRADAPPRRHWSRHIQISILLVGCAAIVAVNAYFILRGPVLPVAASSASAPVGGAPAARAVEEWASRSRSRTELERARRRGRRRPAARGREPPPSDTPPSDKPDRKSNLTVEQAEALVQHRADRWPSRQIVAESGARRERLPRVPARATSASAGHVFLYLDAPARDRLLRVLDAHPDRTMKVHSALRTVAQQYLLSRWAAGKRRGIQLATRPGESNHETGLALDVSAPGLWRSALEREGFRWLGKIDRVHFDFIGPGASHHHGLDTHAFQRLWNRNHPDDTISETGHYDASTESRLKKSPAMGSRSGRAAAGPAPTHAGLPG